MSVKTVTEKNFLEEVLQSEIPVLLDFWAPWCGPCKSLAPVLDDVSEKLKGKVKIVKVDVDQNASLAQDYAVRGIPTILLFKGGEVQANKVGSASVDELIAWVEDNS